MLEVVVVTTQEYYLKLYTDIHSKFSSVLDLISYLNENFPKMADAHRDAEDQKIKKYLQELERQDKSTFEEATTTLRKFENGGGYDLGAMSQKGLQIFIKLIDHKALHQHSQQFVREMALAYIITTFEEFLKETLVIAFSLGSKTKDEWKTLKGEEKEKRLAYLIKLDIKEIAIEIRKKFDLDLKRESDWKDFAECFYRRHILIHNRGIPTKTYKDRTGYSGKDVKLSVDKNYLTNAVTLFRKYSENIEEYFIENQLYMVNVTKKNPITYIDLTKDGGEIILDKED